MIPVDSYANEVVGVLGLGRSGLTAARALRDGGARVLVWDDSQPAREAAEAEGFEVADLARDVGRIAALITSPGIPHLYPAPHPAIAAALTAGVVVDNDIGLFFAALGRQGWDSFDRPPRVVAVTGSNGKSTTAALIHHILQEVRIPSVLAGNIGRGVLDIELPGEGAVVVLELSSYQTELARALTPDVAVFTNLSPDHLDRHSGMGGYFAAKARLFTQGGPDRAVIGVDELEGRYLATTLSVGAADERVIRVASQKQNGQGWQVTTRKGWLSETRKGRQIASLDLRDCAGLPGAHNHQNAACAWAALRALGLGPRQIAEAFKSFEGLPHRSQPVAEINGVRFVNDSKATNIDSAAKALSAFSRIRWICGGLQKEGSMEGLGAGRDNVLKAYVIGREAEGFARQLSPIPASICTEMARAVQEAAAEAEPGDVVLLAPAAASFDQYDNFERRGEDFIRAVEALKG